MNRINIISILYKNEYYKSITATPTTKAEWRISIYTIKAKVQRINFETFKPPVTTQHVTISWQTSPLPKPRTA
jgi:hypothetical protein